jgi:hypothetical protein
MIYLLIGQIDTTTALSALDYHLDRLFDPATA